MAAEDTKTSAAVDQQLAATAAESNPTTGASSTNRETAQGLPSKQSEGEESPECPDDGDNDDNGEPPDGKERKDNDTDATADSGVDEKRGSMGVGGRASSSIPVVSSSKKNRPPYKYDPAKITLRFLFANRDGLTVTVECDPSDTVGEVKGALLSVWPEDLPNCSGGDNLRLVCMGRGYLMPDSRTLEDCQIPTFKTHPTPINVSIRPEEKKSQTDEVTTKKKGGAGGGGHDATSGGTTNNRANASSSSGEPNSNQTSQGCSCILL